MADNFNKEKFTELVSKNKGSEWVTTHEKRKTERSWKKNSTIIALNVLTILEQKKWSQVRLAQEMEVSAAQVSKIVKGQVNFTLESIAKLEIALGRKILNISLIDSEREEHNHEQFVEWLEKAKSISTNKCSKKMLVANITVTSSYTTSRKVEHKEYNLATIADHNLRPTG